MAGLFDLIQSGDPAVNNGLLNFGLSLLQSKGSFGNAVGRAGQVAQLGARDYRQQEELLKRTRLNDELLQMQLEQQQKQVAEQERMRELAKQYYRTPQQQAMAANGGPTVAAANATESMPGGFDKQGYLQALYAEGKLPMALQMEQLLQKQVPQVHTVGADQTAFTLGPNGAPKILMKGEPKADKLDPLSALIAARDALPLGHPNRAIYDAKIAKETTHQPGASVRIVNNTEKGYAGEMAKGLATQDLAIIDAARTAPDRVRSAQDVIRILTTQTPITGTAAETRLALEKALSTAGIIDGTNVRATEDLVNLLSNQTLDAIKTSGLGSGQGFTDKDRQFLQDAKSGRIETNAGTLLRIAQLNERAARATIARGKAVAARIKNDPNFGTVGQDLNFDESDIRLPTPAEIAEEARRRAALRGGR